MLRLLYRLEAKGLLTWVSGMCDMQDISQKPNLAKTVSILIKVREFTHSKSTHNTTTVGLLVLVPPTT